MVISRKAKLLLCFVCSLGLHFSGLHFLPIGTVSSATLPVITVVLREADNAKPSAVGVSVPSTQLQSLHHTTRRAKVDSELWVTRPYDDRAPDPTELDVLAAGTLLVEKFYLSSEVDTPATPIEDWPVAITEGLSRRLYVEAKVMIWVSSVGRIERVEVMEVLPDSQRVKEGLQTMVGAMVKPAMLAGVAVANQRTIQMWLTQ
jgi:hypothetical protein